MQSTWDEDMGRSLKWDYELRLILQNVISLKPLKMMVKYKI